MKKSIFLIIVFTLGISVFSFAKHFWRGDTLSLKKVCKKWGNKEFTQKAFLEVHKPEERSDLACSLLEKKKEFIGLDRSTVRKVFGTVDGFYFSDIYPAYMIEVGQKKGDESWQIVFLLNKNEKVKDIVVHKNCCD